MRNTRIACLVSALFLLVGKGEAPAQEPPKARTADPATIVSVKGEVEAA